MIKWSRLYLYARTHTSIYHGRSIPSGRSIRCRLNLCTQTLKTLFALASKRTGSRRERALPPLPSPPVIDHPRKQPETYQRYSVSLFAAPRHLSISRAGARTLKFTDALLDLVEFSRHLRRPRRPRAPSQGNEKGGGIDLSSPSYINDLRAEPYFTFDNEITRVRARSLIRARAYVRAI